MSNRRKHKRGAVNRQSATFIGVWVPHPMVEAIDVAVDQLDLDRSKFLRKAVEEKLRPVEATGKGDGQ